jgi:hypothetical protein
MGYVVTAPLVITKKADGSDLYLYLGSPVPEDNAGEVKRLEDEGFIEKVDGRSSKPAAKPSAESN